MAVFTFNYAGDVGINPTRSAFDASEYTLAQVVATGFLNRYPSAFALQTGDFVFTKCSDGSATMKATNDGSNVTLSAVSNPGEVSQIGAAIVGNIPKYDTTTGDIEDSGIPAANALLTTTDVTDYQEFVPLTDILINSVGTWTRTRVATGNYSLVHTPADDTSVIGIDITAAIRAAVGRGFKLNSIDVVYTIATLALEAHTIVLNSVAYADNVAVAVTSAPLTGSLETATQANPYVTNLTVTTPAFINTAAAKYNVELTVNAAATSVYSFYGINLHFTKSVA